MSLLREFVGLPPRARQLVMKAVALVAVIRVALWLLPFPTARRVIAPLGRRSPRAARPLTPELIDGRAFIVSFASRFVPQASCLTQALALQILLSRTGNPSSIRIGVAREGRKALEAHAWLECDGRVVIGGGQVGRYAPLLSLETNL